MLKHRFSHSSKIKSFMSVLLSDSFLFSEQLSDIQIVEVTVALMFRVEIKWLP